MRTPLAKPVMITLTLSLFFLSDPAAKADQITTFAVVNGVFTDGSTLTGTVAIDTTASLICGSVPTLVACDGGMSRSPAIVAAALAVVEDTAPERELERVAAAGPHDVSTSFWAEVRDAIDSDRR